MGRNFWLALDRNFWEANKGNKDGQLPAKVQELLDKGADVHAATDNGQTALHFACTYQAGPEVVALLLGKGADVHAVGNFKRTALHWACEKQAGLEVLGSLLHAGAENKNLREKDGTPLLTPKQVAEALGTGQNPTPI